MASNFGNITPDDSNRGPARFSILSNGSVVGSTNPLPVSNNLAIARGLITGQSLIYKFALNEDVAASSTESISKDGVLVMPTSASTVKIKAGGDANDTAAGTGAREITIVGLDENWQNASEAVATAGASASSATTTTFIRVFHAYVSSFGTAFTSGTAGGNAADITIQTNGGTDLIIIPQGDGQSKSSLYTIPSGYTGYLTRTYINVDSNKSADVHFYKRENADDVTVPVQGRIVIAEYHELIGASEKHFNSYPVFTEKTDLWFTSEVSSGSDSGIALEYDLILIQNT